MAEKGSKMKIRSILVVACLALFLMTSFAVAKDESASGGLTKLTGAGASFPAPLYNKWFKDYYAAHKNVQVDYQSVGSGSGIKNFMNKTVDFGASDAAMKPEDIAKVDVGVQLLPMTAGSIVLSYNLKGIPELKLSREAYTGIFLGRLPNGTILLSPRQILASISRIVPSTW